MQKRKFDELVSYFNKKVFEMEIETKYKMELLGMVTALGCAHEKEMSDLSETKRDSSDTISRQAAIDALQKEIDKAKPPFDDTIGAIRCGVRLARNIIEDLPSAEPVRCKDCKFYDQFWNGDWCSLKNIDVKDAEDFCSYAERGTE